jgi:hypothetical protein
MEWTRERVNETLRSNQSFNELIDEWNGVFNLQYNIEGNTVVIHNTIGGLSESYIIPYNRDTICDTCDFAIIAKDILQEYIDNNQ